MKVRRALWFTMGRCKFSASVVALYKYLITFLVLSFNKTQAPKVKTCPLLWWHDKALYMTSNKDPFSYDYTQSLTIVVFIYCTFRLMSISVALPFVSIFFVWLEFIKVRYIKKIFCLTISYLEECNKQNECRQVNNPIANE